MRSHLASLGTGLSAAVIYERDWKPRFGFHKPGWDEDPGEAAGFAGTTRERT